MKCTSKLFNFEVNLLPHIPLWETSSGFGGQLCLFVCLFVGSCLCRSHRFIRPIRELLCVPTVSVCVRARSPTNTSSSFSVLRGCGVMTRSVQQGATCVCCISWRLLHADVGVFLLLFFFKCFFPQWSSHRFRIVVLFLFFLQLDLPCFDCKVVLIFPVMCFTV